MDANEKELWCTPDVNVTAAIICLDSERKLNTGLPAFKRSDISKKTYMYFQKSPGLFTALSLIEQDVAVPVGTLIKILKICRGKMLAVRDAESSEGQE
jgi:hypothetical protein